MAIAKASAEAQVAAIKQALTTPTTCSTNTVESLEWLLNSPREPRSTTSTPSEAFKSSKKAIGTLKNTRTVKPEKQTKARSNNKIPVLESSVGREAILTTQEKQKLATEVFNLSLKTLSAEIKGLAKPAQPPRAQDGKHRRISTSSRQPLSRTASLSQEPLQSLSPNRMHRSPAGSISLKLSPATSTLLKPSSSSVVSVLQGRTAIGECASLALSALRMLKGGNDQGGSAAALELEHGVSALVGKLLLLGAVEQAGKELRAWRKRLDELMKARGPKKPGKPVAKHEAKGVDHRSTAIGLLRFENLEADGSLLCVIIEFQCHVLKHIAAERKLSALSEIDAIMAPPNPASPSALILQSLACKAQTIEKAAQQLQTVAQTVWTMSSSLLDFNNEVDCEGKMRQRSTTIFRLQILSFELLVLWWKASGHRFDIESEFWAPFSRCLATFIHRASAPSKDDYQVAKDGLSRLQGGEQALQIPPTNSSKAVASILKSLAQVARQIGNRSEAVHFLGQSVVISDSAETSVVPWTTNQCQLACLQLEQLSASTDLAAPTHIQNATKGLKGDLRGSSADLDDLLLEAARLNRLGLLYLAKKMPLSEENPNFDSNCEASRVSLTSFAQVFPHFLLRHIGEPPASTDKKILRRYDQRMQKLRSIAATSIEAVTFLARSSVNDGCPIWDVVESLLTEYITVADRLDSMAQEDTDISAHLANSKPSPHVNISNVYWARHLQLKQSDSPPIDVWKPLRKAVALLRDRAVLDKINGFATVKLERLALSYCDLRRVNEAKETFDEAFRCYLDIGALQNIALRARTDSLSSLWFQEGDHIAPLRRLLASHFKFTYERDSNLSVGQFYDDTTLPKEERGILLELQLMTLLTLRDAKDTPQADCLEGVFRTLLTVYDAAEYPLRRLRAILRVLRFSSRRGNVIDPSMTSSLLSELSDRTQPADAYSKDAGLEGYAAYFAGARLLCIFFLGDRAQPEILDTAVSLWSSLLTTEVSSMGSRIENAEEFSKQLEIVVDYCDMQGRWFSKLRSLELLCKLYELQGEQRVSPLVTALFRRALQFSRLGYSDEAEKLFAEAQGLLDNSEVTLTARIRWHLAYAEHLLDIGNTERCSAHLEVARGLHDFSIKTNSKNATDNSIDKQSLDRSISDACHVYSLLAFNKGELVSALYHARRCVMLNMRTWVAIERKAQVEEGGAQSNANDAEMDSVVNGISKLAIVSGSSSVSQSFLQSGQGSSYWSSVSRHYHGLSNLSAVSAHFGLFQDAVYYAEQAQKVAETVSAPALISLNKSLRGELWTRAGHLGKGQELLKASLSRSRSPEPTRFTVLAHRRWAEACERSGGQEDANKALVKAQQVLAMISGSNFLGRHQLGPQAVELEETIANLKIVDNEIKPQLRSQKKAAPQKPCNRRPKPSFAQRQVPTNAHSAIVGASSLRLLRGLVLRQKAASTIDACNPLEAASILAEADGLVAGHADHLGQSMLLIRQILLSVMNQLSSHAVYCVLSESTISFPSIKEFDKEKSRQSSFLGPRAANLDLSASTKSRRNNVPSKKTARMRSPVQEVFSDLLEQIMDLLLDVQTTAHKYCSTNAIHTLSALHSRISLIAHATQSGIRPLTRPVCTALYTNLGRSLAFHRERSCIHVEKQVSDRKTLSTWPDVPVSMEMAFWENTAIDPSAFQAKYVDIIPPSWDVISISLGEKRDELIMSKLCAGQIPFLLRLPLHRTNPQDGDEVDFTFDYAKQELLDIINSAQSTSHNARERTATKEKADWWAGREALDRRLETFLRSMEGIWLGGFRGIFSPLNPPVELVSRFSRLLQTILDKHLPSRQKSSKTKGARTQLHSSVLELFVGLGEPKDDSDLDECLTDLLYFVVDILQFHGEHNAYDEIDFDMVVVETIDALRCYHQELRGLAMKKTSNHTILILDRALHAFPWESLPCLDGVSVSRLSSLGCLRDQLIKQYERGVTVSAEDFTIGKTSGAYILNPGGDLKHTQSTFSDRFEGLSNWTAFTGRAPSEDQFREGLEKSDLFLYFGHGSGAQYIRGRTIKRLDRCAAVFLMGCSSGSLTEAGDYEPFGVPWNYMHAGCPALVANLWDVTDKDIDRFAVGVFERWGLLERTAQQETTLTSKKQRSKARTELSPLDNRVMALGEAVANARGECVLRYLNGAAPVIYGIPLYLR